ncbi:ABC transporter permease [Odoribacter laneus]|uniref:ABC3 transporter permease protein domain-containing protein n=1 Tax=Odoribacter laneus YIT 12061 TaxID=742817 RepID=H1DIV2_9BACT|nr:FtsX-like permease family protein [Odoribacter laneus]EHP46714.1 hypothetical protein HMPREF9449_02331 [Odoribacter laneus YIT 12061]
MNFLDLKVFVRSLIRNKLYSIITIIGFAVSLTFVILLSIYIRQELSVDDFHVNKDRIVRMEGEDGANWGALVAQHMQDAFPEIEAYTRIYESRSGYVTTADGNKQLMFTLFVDTAFLDMFSFPIIEGRNFQAKYEVVISRSFARKMFGEESALGKNLNYNENADWLIVGVVDDFPKNTQFKACDALFNFNCLNDNWIGNNNSAAFATYLMTKPGAELTSKIPLIVEFLKKDFWMYGDNYRKQLFLEPLKEVYWSSKATYGIQRNSRMFVSMMMAIVGVILILALINYNNLSVARVGFRAKESAIKKLLGSNNRALFRQFVTESVSLCYVAFILACIWVVSVTPWFNNLLKTHIELSQHITFTTVLFTLLGVGIIGVIAGIIPAFIISNFNPVAVVKGAFRKKTKGVYSKVLISFQYCVAITLIICTLVIWKQTDFMRNYKVGYNKENIIWLDNKISIGQKEALQSEFEQIPGVQFVSFVRGTPIDGGNNQTMTDYAGTGKQISFQRFEVDSNFFNMLDLQVISSGAAYDKDGVWLNETAVKAIEAQGMPQEFMYYDQKCPVLGIVKDFHIDDLTNEIEPLIIAPIQPDQGFWTILVKISSENPAGTFENIKKTYSHFIDQKPFDSGFMDQTLNEWYESEAHTARLVGYFSLLAIVLCMMGILAMATYFIQQRIKEIGVRRVNGATINEILYMLVGSFMKWILLAFVLACPLSCYIMNRWLQDFAYRTNLGLWLFLGAGCMAFFIAALIVGWQSVKAASENPVKALQNE